jgi:SAM-dependent methyltransferase
MENRQVQDIEGEIAELKARWPAHSVPPKMWQQLEELEARLEEAKGSSLKKNDGIFDPSQAPMLDKPDRQKELKPYDLLKNVAGVAPGMTCVDFGSGTGFFALPMVELAGDQGKVYAVDNSEVMLSHIRAKNPPPNLELLKAGVEQTGLSDQIADLCFLSSILHEVPQPANLIAEAARLLKPGGTLVIVEWKAELNSPGPPQKVRISQKQVQSIFEQIGLTFLSYQDWSDNYYVATGKK